MSHRALGQQFAMMRPSELLPHAEPRDGEYERHNVREIADSIKEWGYDSESHDAHTHIHLAHLEDGTKWLANGNHRVHAMSEIGYDKPVKVRLSDYRGSSAFVGASSV